MIAGTFSAMGTTVSVTAEGADGIEATREWFEEVESVCSRFRPGSELSRINTSHDVTHELSPILAAILRAGEDAHRRTGGLVDVGVGDEVIRWGYDRTFDDVTDLPARPSARSQRPAWRVEGRRLRRSQGVRLDVGGVAKGWAADRAVAMGLGSIVSAGGDVASAHPDCRIEVEGPSGETIATVELGVGALATSSRARRRWRVAGAEAHHLIDPRIGAPADTPVQSATVIARTATLAEAGAKAVLILGVDGLAWASRQEWIDGAIVVWTDGAVYATSGVAA